MKNSLKKRTDEDCTGAEFSKMAPSRNIIIQRQPYYKKLNKKQKFKYTKKSLKETEVFSEEELNGLIEIILDYIHNHEFSNPINIFNLVNRFALKFEFGKDFVNTDQFYDVVARIESII